MFIRNRKTLSCSKTCVTHVADTFLPGPLTLNQRTAIWCN